MGHTQKQPALTICTLKSSSPSHPLFVPGFGSQLRHCSCPTTCIVQSRECSVEQKERCDSLCTGFCELKTFLESSLVSFNHVRVNPVSAFCYSVPHTLLMYGPSCSLHIYIYLNNRSTHEQDQLTLWPNGDAFWWEIVYNLSDSHRHAARVPGPILGISIIFIFYLE